jgi:hypothetical protein
MPFGLSHRASLGAESWHLLLPPMPAFRLRASDIKLAAGFELATKNFSMNCETITENQEKANRDVDVSFGCSWYNMSSFSKGGNNGRLLRVDQSMQR